MDLLFINRGRVTARYRTTNDYKSDHERGLYNQNRFCDYSTPFN